ncbi:MAG: cytochrome c biogenesis protein CcsA [Bacteroidetes bacterium]|nr:cytochrome c biogenesis protein CcsA [Bacteroidota bacterium]MBS1642445.1 cytochrome c biogenesis protein CcsA [Bacteroidota bacterium]MBS1671555.1 cytochrome c biogenesis protein CcsA [Bacteroidota bacterium]
MHYNGEHLLPGQLGHFLVILSLASSLVATIGFFKANKTNNSFEKNTWLKYARISFLIETISIFSVFGILYFLVANHYHEYFFAWNHSSRSLQPKYLLACIWEDQSGSFLLWSMWHCVLGWIIIWKQKKWEAPVLTVVNFAQFCLATMLLGIYVFGVRIGNEPFILWRQHMPDLPLFTNPDYLQLPRVFEGNDLNTLLQNYWMVIHPPILFLGFASTVIPFAFAYAGLANKDHSWVKTSIPWTGFSAAVLGTGIMMGAAWAYESLSFGGYWAWDPVENASLVPWLTLIAGLHTNLIYKSSGYSLKSTYFFYIISFVLVLYSTFLTRSGVLGDTSVHAFTIDDKHVVAFYTQLISFILLFFIPAMWLFFKNYKTIPTIKKEENSYSREFWMFIGSMVFFLSAIVIIFKTSTPVFNKVFGTNIAPPEDPEFAYNQIQIFVAIVIGVLTATTQYLRYKQTPKNVFVKKIIYPTVIALAISIAISVFGDINFTKKGIGFLGAIHIAIFAAVYAVVANAGYIWLVLKGKIKAAGASVAHIGFGLVLVGILISSSKKAVLSWNTTGIAMFKQEKNENPAENITLFKGIATDMGKYMVTYTKDTFNEKERKRFYEIHFENKQTKDTFNLYPDIIKNNKGMEGFSANPSSKHYWNKDIFVYISSFQQNKQDDTTHFENHEIKVGDTVFYSKGFIILNKVDINPATKKEKYAPDEAALFLNMEVVAKDGRRYAVAPGIAIKNNQVREMPDSVISQSLVLKFNKVINGDAGKLEVGVKESSAITDLVTLKVYEFPMINVLWIGIVIMVIGFVMSIRQRNRKSALTAS